MFCRQPREPGAFVLERQSELAQFATRVRIMQQAADHVDRELPIAQDASRDSRRRTQSGHSVLARPGTICLQLNHTSSNPNPN